MGWVNDLYELGMGIDWDCSNYLPNDCEIAHAAFSSATSMPEGKRA